MKIKKKVALSGLLLCCAITAKAQVCITPQAEQRARELVSQMTLEEKIDYISGPKSFYIRAVPPAWYTRNQDGRWSARHT